jgi:arsenate reductase
MKKKKADILILCTGNSCRSQMAEVILQSFDSELYVVSAGTQPSKNVHPKTIEVMAEKGFDLSTNQPKNVNDFINHSFDYVITVCDGAKETCPVFQGQVKQQLHIGFDDPAEVTGSDTYVLSEFRRVRDEIYRDFKQFYRKCLEK